MIGQQSDRLPEFGCIHENINVDISPHRTFHNPKLVIVDKNRIFLKMELKNHFYLRFPETLEFLVKQGQDSEGLR